MMNRFGVLQHFAKYWLVSAAIISGALALDANNAHAQSVGTLTTVHTFSGWDGVLPNGPLIKAGDENLYGTTAYGGTSNFGTIFRMSPDGSVTTLHSFVGSDGSQPSGPLILASDGNFYGMTRYGGLYGKGTVFRMTSSAQLSTLYSFAGPDGFAPTSSLAEGNDGNLYGTTAYGGRYNLGTIFSITSAGVLTTLYTFDGTVGYAPSGSFIKGTDGQFYGGTVGGGFAGTYCGTVFSITAAGAFSVLHNFVPAEGCEANTGVIQGDNGTLYGVTYLAGANGDGTVYSLTTSGTFTLLHTFAGSDGWLGSGLTVGSDGNLYGETTIGGATYSSLLSGYGCAFRLSPDGTFTTIYSFDDIDGSSPAGGLTEVYGGHFVGVASSGGYSESGTIFQLNVNAATPSQELTGVLKAPNWIQLSWNPIFGAAAYNVYMGTMPNSFGTEPIRASVKKTTVNITGLAAGRTYYFKVSPINLHGGIGQPSKEVGIAIE